MSNDFKKERSDLAAAFRWAARLNMHEDVSLFRIKKFSGKL